MKSPRVYLTEKMRQKKSDVIQCEKLSSAFTQINGVSSLQETVPAHQRNFTAVGLRSGTDYLVTVIAQFPNSVEDAVSAKKKTSE